MKFHITVEILHTLVDWSDIKLIIDKIRQKTIQSFDRL